jgi:8-hydroxy-5-deazaflavin:NADPH oxidoreductase
LTEKVAIIGGTGAEGSGLAARFARAGRRVFLGSRSAEKAVEAAQKIKQRAGSGDVSGHTNAEAAALAGVVIITVPLSAHSEILKSIRASLDAEKIVVDATVPLEVAIGGRLSRVVTLWDGSAAQQAVRMVPAGVPVVAAFHSLSADALAKLDEDIECDALICGDSAGAKRTVSQLAESIPGVRAIDAGSLDNARYLEICAAMLIALNLQHKVKNSGMRITGLLRCANISRHE